MRLDGLQFTVCVVTHTRAKFLALLERQFLFTPMTIYVPAAATLMWAAPRNKSHSAGCLRIVLVA